MGRGTWPAATATTTTSSRTTATSSSRPGEASTGSSVSFTLGENVDNLRLVGDSFYLSGYGNELDNILIGTTMPIPFPEAGNDWIDAGGWNDTLSGGDGDDTLYSGDGAILLWTAAAGTKSRGITMSA